ncbi:hypothetical protein ABKV19_002177 [Rosa sericea]
MITTPSLAVYLLLLSLLLSQAQGIRLEKGFISVKQQNKNIHEDSTVLTPKSESTAASGVLSKDCGRDDHCLSSGTTSLKKIKVPRSSSSSSAISPSEKSSSSHSHHWLPRIHEDYCGPRRHRSKHH